MLCPTVPSLQKAALMCAKVPGTKRVDHKRAVKIYERAAGDKTLPSDLRPPPVLKVRKRCVMHAFNFNLISSIENVELSLPRPYSSRRIHTNLWFHSRSISCCS